MYVKSPNCPFLSKEKVVLNAQEEDGDGESSQQCLLSPARARALDIRVSSRTRRTQGSKGMVGQHQDRAPVEFGEGKLCWFPLNLVGLNILLYFSDKDH